MANAPGKCLICKKPFLSGDDVVTCPSCGAPYHRACYQQEGHCIYEDKHSASFEYTMEEPAAAGEGVASGKAAGALCRNCQTINDANNIFCDNCGMPLHQPAVGQPFSRQNAPVGAAGVRAADWDDESGTKIDDIPVRDWGAFIRVNSQVYLQRMANMKAKNSKLSFTVSAFFLGPAYFAYRKMWGWAWLALGITYLTLVPSTLLFGISGGVNLVPGIPLNTLNIINTVAYYGGIVLRLLCGLFAVYIYQKNGGRKIRQLKQTAPDNAAYHDALPKAGGVNPLAALLMAVLWFAFIFAATSLFMSIGGEAFVNTILELYGMAA